MTTIYNTDTGKVEELELIYAESDALRDIIAEVALPEWQGVRGEYDFRMDTESIEWWRHWAEREQRITDALEELEPEDHERIISQIDFSDYEAAQDHIERLLGL